MHWIIQEDFQNENQTRELIHNLYVLGIKHTVCKIVPFAEELDPVPTMIEGERVMLYGSYYMKRIAKKYGYQPGWFDLGESQFSRQMHHWGAYMFNADAEITRIKKMVRVDDKYKTFPLDVNTATYLQELFIKPMDDSKAFDADVFTPEEFIKMQEDYAGKGMTIDPEMLVIYAKPKPVAAEYRCWIINGEVVTQCQYKRNRRFYVNSHVDEYIVGFAQGLAEMWSPAQAYVMDIFQSDKLYIGEINSFNAAGLYQANTFSIVRAIESIK